MPLREETAEGCKIYIYVYIYGEHQDFVVWSAFEKDLWVDGLEIRSRPVGNTYLGVMSVEQVIEVLGMDMIRKYEGVE